jgi:three-Cys-motif partner protein
LAPTITQINIFDVFCGTGIYDNGKKGSPIVSFEAVQALRGEYGFEKPINLIINDSAPEKIEAVSSYIGERNQNHCAFSYYNLPANEMFVLIEQSLQKQGNDVRNLLFVDPYGYKEIKKDRLERLLANQRTEIILFLPISQMQRFTTKAVASDLKPYEPLKEFVHSFFPGDHPLKERTVRALEYINYVKDALRFGRYHSTAYFIERDESNYYALFFIGPSIYGFEKILEVKWQLDEDSGRGFKQPDSQAGLFDQQHKELTRLDNYRILEGILEVALREPKNNREIHEIILKHEYLPKHAAEVFRNWQNEHRNFHVTDAKTGQPVRKGSFYLGWESYNPAKNKVPKAIFLLD